MNQKRIINVLHNVSQIKSVVYIMHNAFRIKNNHSLYHAINYNVPLDIYLIQPLDTHQRTLDFFEKGIRDYEKTLTSISRSTKLINRKEIQHIQLSSSTLVVMDMYYLKEEKELYEMILEQSKLIGSGLHLIETNTMIPVTETSSKEEYSAKTIRSKIHKKLDQFVDPVLQDEMQLPGELEAREKLDNFIEKKLKQYKNRSNPGQKVTSELSPYLKYGFISVLEIFRSLKGREETEDFIEELIVRRDLAYNFVYYNPRYYDFHHMTYGWAYATMINHLEDEREYLYTVEDYIHFRTHDVYFNTAMKEMVYLGTMHNYMRMYWCKKIVEWSSTYEEAYNIAIYLNNHYFIDGFTPNGYTGVAWCFGKHDRAWKERVVFGKLRYMNANGLERKFDMQEYIQRIEKEVVKYEE